MLRCEKKEVRQPRVFHGAKNKTNTFGTGMIQGTCRRIITGLTLAGVKKIVRRLDKCKLN